MSMKIKLIPLSKFGIDEHFLAHTPDETLIAHSDLTIKYYKKIISSKNLETLIENLIKEVDEESFEFIYEMFVNAIYLHDVGKKNPYFQAKKMNNPYFQEYKESTISSNHSKNSADEYLSYFLEKINLLNNRKRREKFKFILYSFSYHIQKHHGSLGKFEEYREDDNHLKYLHMLNVPTFEFFILNRLLFSLLVSSDYYATAQYKTKIVFDKFGCFSEAKAKKAKALFDFFRNKLKDTNGINYYRDLIFRLSEEKLLKNIDKNIFYLEAPTGSGKTITSINIALNLLINSNINKIFYIFPFNTLVEQTKFVFDDIFKDEVHMEIINSITPMQEVRNDNEIDYTKSYMQRLFFHSEIILSTHIQFFNILFGTSKEDNFALWQLANSVIILDEIQSYDNNLWWYMVEFFSKYAKALNIKIVIMSATLPKLDVLLEKNDNFVELLDKKMKNEIFSNSYFRDRVSLDFSLLKKKNIALQELYNEFCKKKAGYKKVLIEFIKKQSAREFYELIKDEFRAVYELSGDDNRAYREFVINESKKDKEIIIVATQVIEAGVDIDMDVGFKDISTLDSEEQFLGRINRSAKKKNAKAYFFNMDDTNGIYKNDNRIAYTLKSDRFKAVLVNKDFESFYTNVLRDIKIKGLKFLSGLLSNKDKFDECLQRLNYTEVSSTMRLIKSQNFILYFPFKIDLSKYEIQNLDSAFITDNSLDGKKVWQKFTELQNIDNFTQKEFEKSHINSFIQFFTFNITKYNSKSRPCMGEEIYGYFYVEDYEEFIKDGKFDRVAYQEKCDGIFL